MKIADFKWRVMCEYHCMCILHRIVSMQGKLTHTLHVHPGGHFIESRFVNKHHNEHARLGAVLSYQILDSVQESDFDQLVALACQLFDVPMATVSIMDQHRQWFKAAKGLDICETAREVSFCQYAIRSQLPLLVEDTHLDPRFMHNPMVTFSPYIRAYAGIPLINGEGYVIGTFCIMAHHPRTFTQSEQNLLKMLANQVMKLLELRREIIQRTELSDQLRRIYESQSKAQELWKQAMDAVGDGVWDCDLDSGHYFFGPNWLKMLGYGQDELVPHFVTLYELLHDDDKPRFEQQVQAYLSGQTSEYKIEYKIRCKDGEYKWVLSRGMVVERDSEKRPLRMIGTHTDISQSKMLEQSIWQQANFDPLTGLPNRRLFLDRLQQQINMSQREDKQFAVVFIDLDGFKAVNDAHGHLVGDQLLVAFSQRIQAFFRQSDTFARFAGDEFAMILGNMQSQADMTAFAEKIIEAAEQPFALGQLTVQITTSIGLACYPQHGTEVDDLLRHSDTAMYAAKAQGKNSWVLYALEM